MSEGQTILSTLKTESGDIPILGDVLWWNLREVEVTQEWFKQQLDAVGLNGEKYAKEHNYRSTFIRCLRYLEEQRIIRPVTEDNVRLVYQFTAEQLIADDPENPHLKYTPEGTVGIDKEAYYIEEDFDAALVKCDPKVREILVPMFNKEKQTYRSSDLTRYIQRILNDLADIVSLRPQGAVYFVPSNFRDVVQKLSTVLSAVPVGQARMDYFPVPDVQSSRQMIGSGVEAEIAQLFSQMESETAKMKSGGKEITDKWIEYRVDKVKAIKKRLDLYAEVLGETADRLNGKADELIKLVSGRVLEI